MSNASLIRRRTAHTSPRTIPVALDRERNFLLRVLEKSGRTAATPVAASTKPK